MYLIVLQALYLFSWVVSVVLTSCLYFRVEVRTTHLACLSIVWFLQQSRSAFHTFFFLLSLPGTGISFPVSTFCFVISFFLFFFRHILYRSSAKVWGVGLFIIHLVFLSRTKTVGGDKSGYIGGYRYFLEFSKNSKRGGRGRGQRSQSNTLARFCLDGYLEVSGATCWLGLWETCKRPWRSLTIRHRKDKR